MNYQFSIFVQAAAVGDDLAMPLIVKLPKPLTLDHTWSVCIADIVWKHVTGKSKRMFIESDIVQSTCCGSTFRPIIGTVPLASLQQRNLYFAPHHRLYQPIRVNATVTELAIYIKDDDNNILPNFKGPFSLQLHFKRF